MSEGIYEIFYQKLINF